MKKTGFLITLFTLILVSACISAIAEIEETRLIDSRVSEVSVFSDRAQVKRIGSASLDAGEFILKFDNLPWNLEQNSIQIGGIGEAIVSDIKIFTRNMKEEYRGKLDSLKTAKAGLMYDKQELEDKISHIKSEKDFLGKIVTKLTANPEGQVASELDPDKWIKMVNFYRTKLDELDKDIRITDRERTEIGHEIEKIKSEINKYANLASQQKHVAQARVKALKKGRYEFTVSYIVYGASWYPSYDIRVDSEENKMNITYNAVVTQTTGEDWDDVKMKLSTAKPNVGASHPELMPWWLNIVQQRERMYSKSEMVQWDIDQSDMSQMYNAFEPEMAERSMSGGAGSIGFIPSIVETQVSSAVFTPEGRNTVKCDGKPNRINISMSDFDAVFRYSAVPKLSEFAYLKAKVTNSTEYPLLPGTANVFLNNNYVTNTMLNFVAPTEEFWVFLGVDEGIKIEHKLIKKYEEEEGIITDKTKMIYEYQITAKNNKKTEEELVIWDQIPKSSHEDIVVELLKPEIEKNSDKLKINEDRFIEWFYNIEPGEEIKIDLRFSVEYPAGLIIQGL